jgi:hypothetical protein
MGLRVWFLTIACVAALAACANLPAVAPGAGAPLRRTAQSRTTASGLVVDDPSGRALAGILVRLEPWKRGCVKTSPRTASCPGYLPWRAVTDRAGRFRLSDVPDGDYLLVIGSDSPADLARPTIHDHVTFAGGVRELRAPTLPAIPCNRANYKVWCQGVAPSPGITPFPRPAVEKHGAYRLAAIDPKRERPCALEFNAQRSKRHLPPVVVDEWLTENSREILAYRDSTRRAIPHPVPLLAPLGNTLLAGGSDCSELISGAFLLAQAEATDPRTIWMDALWYAFDHDNQAGGVAQFPVDVRLREVSTMDPWP